MSITNCIIVQETNFYFILQVYETKFQSNLINISLTNRSRLINQSIKVLTLKYLNLYFEQLSNQFHPMMQSEIIQRTPSVYFKFDDESHRNFSKSSFALDYSISNHKNAFPNNRVHRIHNNQTGQKYDVSPLMKKSLDKHTDCRQNDEDQFMALYGCKRVCSSSVKQPKLKTEEFFQQFQRKYEITFEYENDVFVNQWIPEADYEGGSGISRGNLNFQEINMDQTIMLIKIQSKKQVQLTNVDPHQDFGVENLTNFAQTNCMEFYTELSLTQDRSQTNKAGHETQEFITNQISIQEFSPDKENSQKNQETSFQEVISFGPDTNNQTRTKKYRALKSRHFVTKGFQNNSSLLQRNGPIIEMKRRVPLKSIENLIRKNSQENQSAMTRKKPIINTDLLISTINRAEKNQSKQTNCVRSNPINSKKSSSLECTFTFDNMFKTNAFRETLKSTTLENWKKKYHMKIEHNGDNKTVTKKRRNVNIFDNLFIRA